MTVTIQFGQITIRAPRDPVISRLYRKRAFQMIVAAAHADYTSVRLQFIHATVLVDTGLDAFSTFIESEGWWPKIHEVIWEATSRRPIPLNERFVWDYPVDSSKRRIYDQVRRPNGTVVVKPRSFWEDFADDTRCPLYLAGNGMLPGGGGTPMIGCVDPSYAGGVFTIAKANLRQEQGIGSIQTGAHARHITLENLGLTPIAGHHELNRIP